MYTKSTIQQIQEERNAVASFKKEVRRCTKAYDVTEAVFVVHSWNPKSGYIDMKREFDSIEEALSEVKFTDDCLYVVSPEQVIVGKYKNTISECESSVNILDVSTKTVVSKY